MGDRNDLVERHHRSLGGRPAPGSAGERHSISMTSDQHHLLAVLSTPPGAKSRCSSVVLEIAAARRDEHRQVDGTQREMVFVRFNTLAWPLTLPAPDGGRRGPSLESRVTGEIKGWVRPDGRIDLSLGGLRALSIGERVQASGSLSRVLEPGDAEGRPGVDVREGKAVVDLGKFFERSETSILVTARRRR